MKIFNYFLAFVLACSSNWAWAEPKIYIRSDGQFVANGNEYARGFWIPKIYNAEEVFAGHPIAAEAYEMHKKRAVWFSALNWGAVGAAGVYAIISSGGDDFDSGTFWTIFFIPWVGGLFAGASSNRHLIKAINIVNGVAAESAEFRQPAHHPTQVAKRDVTLPVFTYSF